MIVAISKNLRVRIDVLAASSAKPIITSCVMLMLSSITIGLSVIYRMAPADQAEPTAAITLRSDCASHSEIAHARTGLQFTLFMAFPRFRGAE